MWGRLFLGWLTDFEGDDTIFHFSHLLPHISQHQSASSPHQSAFFFSHAPESCSVSPVSLMTKGGPYGGDISRGPFFGQVPHPPSSFPLLPFYFPLPPFSSFHSPSLPLISMPSDVSRMSFLSGDLSFSIFFRFFFAFSSILGLFSRHFFAAFDV